MENGGKFGLLGRLFGGGHGSGKLIKRAIQPQLEALACMYPVVTITGPRQSGKTTLAKAAFPNYSYASLENFDLRRMAQSDPHLFLREFKPPVILDEIQRVPELLSYIQTAVDENGSPGQYILAGSHQPLLAQGVAQSLAGRTGILRLLPLAIEELTAAGIVLERDKYICNGFMPRLYNSPLTAENLYRDYFATYAEKDLRLLLNIKELSKFEVFVRLLAGRVGQLVNMSSLSNDVGVSVQTVSHWLSVLEASYIIFQLPCYFENFGKRLVKSRKLYFIEVGLAAWLLGIIEPEQAARDPLLGGLFENMVVVEALKHRLNAGKTPELYFLRDSKGLEIDLVCRKSNDRLLPVEIKAGSTWDPEFSRNLRAAKKLSEKFTDGCVVYSGNLTSQVDGVKFLNFKETGGIIP